MKLWNSNNEINKRIESFTIGKDNVYDLELARFDVIGSKAHVTMLAKVGILSTTECENLNRELNNILEEIDEGHFKIDSGIEDIHSQIEFILIKKLGVTAKKMHTARSRNDQVLLDLRLYFRAQIDCLLEESKQLIHTMVQRSEESKDYLMPGFTHMQIGMVSSFGMWFGCYGEALIDDFNHLKNARKLINQNPLGSAAGYGSSFPIDRQITTDLLAFDNLCYNSMYAQFGRGKTELIVAQGLTNLAFTISKFAYDICLFSNQNYALVKLPDAFTTGSSIMPHKKNPDVFELIRSRCNQIQSIPNQILMIIQNLPSGYHRDFQQLKEIIFPAFATIREIVKLLSYVVPQLEINKNALEDKKYDLLYSVDNINALVQEGMSMRDAYFKVKESIANHQFIANKNISHSHMGSLGNLCNDRILKKIE